MLYTLNSKHIKQVEGRAAISIQKKQEASINERLNSLRKYLVKMNYCNHANTPQEIISGIKLFLFENRTTPNAFFTDDMNFRVAFKTKNMLCTGILHSLSLLIADAIINENPEDTYCFFKETEQGYYVFLRYFGVKINLEQELYFYLQTSSPPNLFLTVFEAVLKPLDLSDLTYPRVMSN